MIKIEFFHDVICSFCFPMSYQMHLLNDVLGNRVQIIHRSFALAPNNEAFTLMFGSRTAAKEEILQHWQHANSLDDQHRFNIDGMRAANFPFPTSMPALLACQAAYCVASDNGYWQLFDCLQKAFFMQSRNIGEVPVIEDCVKETTINFAQWQQFFNDKATQQAVEADFKLANSYGINSVPTLVINETRQINGLKPFDKLVALINTLAVTGEGESCKLGGSC
jgi:predicted DsbA family dithiol-disulfide isomerase